MNLYVTLDRIKSKARWDYQGSNEDEAIRQIIESASRDADGYCRRHFYELKQTKYFDGDGGIKLFVPDLIAITTLKTDDNDDRTFETSWSNSDYFLLPFNTDPTTRLNPQSAPYWAIEADPQGDRTGFPNGRKLIEIAGFWGYWRHLKRASETADEITDATATTISVSALTDIEAGHTILIDSEQIFVESYETNTLTVVRGVNGTTAATHSAAAAIDIYEYPPNVVEATEILATHAMTGRGGNVMNVQPLPDGSFMTERGRNPWKLLDHYALPLMAVV